MQNLCLPRIDHEDTLLLSRVIEKGTTQQDAECSGQMDDRQPLCEGDLHSVVRLGQILGAEGSMVRRECGAGYDWINQQHPGSGKWGVRNGEKSATVRLALALLASFETRRLGETVTSSISMDEEWLDGYDGMQRAVAPWSCERQREKEFYARFDIARLVQRDARTRCRRPCPTRDAV